MVGDRSVLEFCLAALGRWDTADVEGAISTWAAVC